MSLIDQKKEKNEENCLNAVILLSKQKHALTRNILNKLDGIPINRVKKDRPDIIRRYLSADNSGEEIYVGIEHFRVDQASKIKAGKTHSLAAESKQHLKDIYENGHQLVLNKQPISEELLHQLAKEHFNYAAVINETGYDELIQSFDIVLNKHITKAAEYRKNIEEFSNGKKVELAFLIEIHCNIFHSFFNYGRNTSENKENLFPITDEIVSILKKVDYCLVDYIVLYIVNEDYHPEHSNVIAVRTESIEKDLRKQKVLIYTFCGNSIPVHYSLDETIKTNNGIQANYTVTPSFFDNYMKQFLPGLQKAYNARKEGKPYMTTRSIQALMYSFGTNVSFF